MKSFPATELKQNLSDGLAAADRDPVAITKHRKTRSVLMDVETFETRFAQDSRRSDATRRCRQSTLPCWKRP
jgi:prevent-host-death family protein